MLNNITAQRKEKLKLLFEKSPFWTAYGVFYGFPDCCIEGFVNDTNMDTKETYIDLPSHGTGYIPCICCAPKVEHDWESFKEQYINRNRISSLEFPYDYNDKENDRFFYHLSNFFGYDPVEVAEFCDLYEILPILKEEAKLEKQKLPINNKFLKFLENNPEFIIEELQNYIEEQQQITQYLDRNVKSMMKKYVKEKAYWDKLELVHSQDTNNNERFLSPTMLIKERLKDKFSVICRLPKNNQDYKKVQNMLEDLVERAYFVLEMKVYKEIEQTQEDNLIIKNKIRKF